MSTFRGYVHESTGVFTLDPLDKAKFLAYVKRFKGEECEIDFRKRRTKRSLRANAAWHAAIGPWAAELGYDIEDLKDAVLEQVFGLKEVTNPLTGEVKSVLAEPHSSSLDTAQFCFLMEQTAIIAAGTGYLIEMPEEYKARKRVA